MKSTTAHAAFILIWSVGMAALLSLLMASHMVPLPAPSKPRAAVDLRSPTLSTPQAAGGDKTADGRWKVVHILVAGCPCSSFTAKSLAERKPSAECQEVVLVVGGVLDCERDLVQSGFEVRHKDATQLASDIGIEGGPWLLLISPEGKIAYSGGYAAQRPRPGIILEDSNIVRAALSGQALPSFPAYGCAATPGLRRRLDPFGFCQSIQ